MYLSILCPTTPTWADDRNYMELWPKRSLRMRFVKKRIGREQAMCAKYAHRYQLTGWLVHAYSGKMSKLGWYPQLYTTAICSLQTLRLAMSLMKARVCNWNGRGGGGELATDSCGSWTVLKYCLVSSWISNSPALNLTLPMWWRDRNSPADEPT